MFFCNQKGITLLELMLVIVIIAIIGTLAFPTYQSHTIRARSADAKVKLLEIMQEQRKFFTNNNTYTTDLIADLGYIDAGAGKVASDQGLFLISAATCGGGETIAQCVILSAAPQGNQAGTVTLTYNSRNEKTPTTHW